MNLPESVLLCLFPNGLVLSRQSVALSEGGENDEDEEVYSVDVSSMTCQSGAPTFGLPAFLVRSKVLCIRAKLLQNRI